MNEFHNGFMALVHHYAFTVIYFFIDRKSSVDLYLLSAYFIKTR